MNGNVKYVVGLAIAGLALLVPAQPAMARNLPTGGVTRQDIAGWLTRRGLKPTIHNDSEGTSIVSAAAGGINFDIYFYSCVTERCASIQFAAGWTPIANVNATRMNEWNTAKRYIRAYVDTKNKDNVWGEYDVDVSPGGSWEQLDHALDRWSTSIVNFQVFIKQ